MFYTAYEYNIPEKHFLTWAKEKDITLTKIDDASEVIDRCTRYIYYRQSDDGQLKEDDCSASVTQGFRYQITYDNGGGVHIVYDSLAQKAYHSIPDH